MVGAQCVGRVLDIGCGRQPLLGFLPNGCQYIGLDYPDTGAWYEAKPTVHADAARLPFADQTFDVVVCLEVLEHLPRPVEALREACRVLKPEGRVIISTPFLYPIHDAPADYQRWTRHGLELLGRSAGLRVTSLSTLGTPLEAGALVLNLGWAWQILNERVLLKLPVGIFALFAIPAANLVAVFHSSFTNLPGNSPFAIGYVSVFERSDGSSGVAGCG